MRNFVRSRLPKDLVDRIRHSPHIRRYRAWKLAKYSKRIDLCASQIAHGLHLADRLAITGKNCLEIGGGWVLSHAMVLHLLGARKVIVTDILPHADPLSLYNALRVSIPSVIRDVLSPFENHARLRTRVDHLLSLPRFDFGVLAELGIEYVAPIDFAQRTLGQPYDFVFSNSVLEHVPSEDVSSVLQNLVSGLSTCGTMMHFIHLEDHKDLSLPFEHLSCPEADYDAQLQTTRGNRLRKSRWNSYFNELNDVENTLLYEWIREDKDLPSHIDNGISFLNEQDLRVSHVGFYTRKIA